MSSDYYQIIGVTCGVWSVVCFMVHATVDKANSYYPFATAPDTRNAVSSIATWLLATSFLIQGSYAAIVYYPHTPMSFHYYVGAMLIYVVFYVPGKRDPRGVVVAMCAYGVAVYAALADPGLVLTHLVLAATFISVRTLIQSVHVITHDEMGLNWAPDRTLRAIRVIEILVLSLVCASWVWDHGEVDPRIAGLTIITAFGYKLDSLIQPFYTI